MFDGLVKNTIEQIKMAKQVSVDSEKFDIQVSEPARLRGVV